MENIYYALNADSWFETSDLCNYCTMTKRGGMCVQIMTTNPACLTDSGILYNTRIKFKFSSDI